MVEFLLVMAVGTINEYRKYWMQKTVNAGSAGPESRPALEWAGLGEQEA